MTVGGENAVKVYRRGETPALVATIPTGDLPHGIWGSGDGTRVYVGLENQDAVIGIDTQTNTVVATIPVGQQPQALVYVPVAVPEGDGRANLAPLGEAGRAAHLAMAPPPGRDAGAGRATVSVNAVGPLDLVQVAATGLQPGRAYTLWLAASPRAPFGRKEALATFKANPAGAQVVQAVGPLRQVLAGTPGAPPADRRFLVITPADADGSVLVQVAPPPAKP